MPQIVEAQTSNRVFQPANIGLAFGIAAGVRRMAAGFGRAQIMRPALFGSNSLFGAAGGSTGNSVNGDSFVIVGPSFLSSEVGAGGQQSKLDGFHPNPFAAPEPSGAGVEESTRSSGLALIRRGLSICPLLL